MSRCRCSIPRIRFRSAPWSGQMHSPRCASCSITSRTLALQLIPEFAAEFKRAVRTRYRRPAAHLSCRRCGDAGGRHGFGQRHHQGHHRRNACRRLSHRACNTSCRSDRFRPKHCDGCWLVAKHVVVSKRASPSEWAANSPIMSILRLRNTPARRRSTRSSPDWAGVPSRGHPCTACSAAPLAQSWEGAHFLDLNEDIVGKELHHVRKVRRSGPTAENLVAPARARLRSTQAAE